MEGHQNLLAIAGIEDAQSEWQHAAHKVVAVAVHHFTLRIVKAQEELDDDADGHQSYGPSPMAAIEQQSIDDVKLQHQTKEPVRTRQMTLSGFGNTLLNMPSIATMSSAA